MTIIRATVPVSANAATVLMREARHRLALAGYKARTVSADEWDGPGGKEVMIHYAGWIMTVRWGRPRSVIEYVERIPTQHPDAGTRLCDIMDRVLLHDPQPPGGA